MSYDQVAANALKRERKLRRDAAKCISECYVSLAALDKVMQQPSSHERGQDIGRIASRLYMSLDSLAHFGLDQGFKKIANDKARAANKVSGVRLPR